MPDDTPNETKPPLSADLQRRLDEATVAEQEAKTRKAVLDNQAAEQTAQVNALSAVVPKLETVPHTPLDITKDKVLFSNALARRALADAALGVTIPEDLTGTIVITSEADLSKGTGIYLDVANGIQVLKNAADSATAAVTRSLAVSILAAAASALPGILALVSAHRSVTITTTEADDLTAASLVARRLLAANTSANLLHDTFRPVPRGEIHDALTALGASRDGLSKKLIDLAVEKLTAETQLADARAVVAATEAELKKLPKASPDRPDIEKRLGNEKATVAKGEAALEPIASRTALVDTTGKAIDTFSAAIRAVPEGGTRSLLSTAALYEGLYSADAEKRIDYVLLVKGLLGDAAQLIDDKIFFVGDRYSVTVESAITYQLIDAKTGYLQAAGAPSGTAEAHGKIGEKITIEA
jgi:hypothetical protein